MGGLGCSAVECCAVYNRRDERATNFQIHKFKNSRATIMLCSCCVRLVHVELPRHGLQAKGCCNFFVFVFLLVLVALHSHAEWKIRTLRPRVDRVGCISLFSQLGLRDLRSVRAHLTPRFPASIAEEYASPPSRSACARPGRGARLLGLPLSRRWRRQRLP